MNVQIICVLIVACMNFIEASRRFTKFRRFPFWVNKYRQGNIWTLRNGYRNITCYSGKVTFPYGPECADEELSKDLYRSHRIDLGFNLTFMGHTFDKIWVHQHGFVSFQESFYGASVPNHDWPHPYYPYHDDPVFIAPFYAQTDLLGEKIEDIHTTKYGRVLYKVLHRIDLPIVFTEEEKFMYELSMKVLNEATEMVRESVVSTEEFIADHAFIVTWKSIAFSGNSITDVNAKPRNTFQLALFTDTRYTYAFFNYDEIQWYSTPSQGGNPETGTGGKAAKIGFNRGNGTLWHSIQPFSENAQLVQQISNFSNVNINGRYVYRIDEWIEPAGCTEYGFSGEKILQLWTRSGIMLPGTEVGISGPCFRTELFHCKWGDGYDAPITIGEAPLTDMDEYVIQARCIQPLIYYVGRLNLSISLDGGETYEWKAEYTIVDPIRYPPGVELVNIQDWHLQGSPPRLVIRWDKNDLNYEDLISPNPEISLVNIELFGYYEDDDGPHWDLLQVIARDRPNIGSFGFDVAPNRAKNQTMARLYKLGAIRVSVEDSILDPDEHQIIPKAIWSAIHPIGWWRNDEMKFYYDKTSYLFGSSRGRNWPEDQCRWWHRYRQYDRFWMDDLEICPPTLIFAIGDIGVWMPDPECNMYGGEYNDLNCLQHPDAFHCVITMRRTSLGAGNRCCYGEDGNLMYTNDTYSGSTPDRHHFLGQPPYNTYGNVPGLSHYLHDVIPYYLCCRWGDLCDTYLYLRQTKDAKGYKEPRPAVAYGDPHFITFDGKDYTFNGKGEFTLFKSRKYNFRLQGRFEQPPNATYCLLSSKGQINATRITAIAAGQDDSDYVEVRSRVYPMQSEIFGCDIFVNGKTYYFNFTEDKIQIFNNVFVYSPYLDENQSNITIMFNSSGVGVQVGCNRGLLHVRVSAPYSMFKDTAGLFGYWDNITANDFLSPDNSSSQLTMKPDLLYLRFGMTWRIKDESESLFTYSGSLNFDAFHDNKPIIREWQRFRPWFVQSDVPFPNNVSFTKDDLEELCDGDEQCLFDGAAMGSLEIAEATRDAHRFYRFLHENMKAVNSCGIYLMKAGIRTTNTGNYLAGSKMELSCEKGYILFGWPEFYCNWNGTWLPTNGQWLARFRDWPYCEHYHITAIRWTAIGISVLWVLFVAVALIRRYFCRKRSDYIIEEDKIEKSIMFPFKDAENRNEIDALAVFDSNNYSRDGFEHSRVNFKRDSEESAQPLLKEQNVSEEYEKSSIYDQIKNADLKKVDKLTTPAVILQAFRNPIEEDKISSKVFEITSNKQNNSTFEIRKESEKKSPNESVNFKRSRSLNQKLATNFSNSPSSNNNSIPLKNQTSLQSYTNNDDSAFEDSNKNNNQDRNINKNVLQNLIKNKPASPWTQYSADSEEYSDQYERVNLRDIKKTQKLKKARF